MIVLYYSPRRGATLSLGCFCLMPRPMLHSTTALLLTIDSFSPVRSGCVSESSIRTIFVIYSSSVYFPRTRRGRSLRFFQSKQLPDTNHFSSFILFIIHTNERCCVCRDFDFVQLYIRLCLLYSFDVSLTFIFVVIIIMRCTSM